MLRRQGLEIQLVAGGVVGGDGLGVVVDDDGFKAGALSGESGVVGPDERKGAKICACEFPSIKGGKPFNVRKGSFRKMLSEIGQPKPRKKRTAK